MYCKMFQKLLLWGFKTFAESQWRTALKSDKNIKDENHGYGLKYVTGNRKLQHWNSELNHIFKEFTQNWGGMWTYEKEDEQT